MVVVDIKQRKILDEFHHYIKPVKIPKLFPFCIQLTGIQQDQVDAGILLEDALERLDEFIKKFVISSIFPIYAYYDII